MEAALRTAYEIKTGRPIPNLEVKAVRGLDGVKECTVDLDGLQLKCAVVNGAAQTQKLLERLQKGEVFYHFIEVMACPCGCIGGGGQPRSSDGEVVRKRMEEIYSLDERSHIRKSHENPSIKALYDQFLGHPLGHVSHELLHTHYHSRKHTPAAAAEEEARKEEAPQDDHFNKIKS